MKWTADDVRERLGLLPVGVYRAQAGVLALHPCRQGHTTEMLLRAAAAYLNRDSVEIQAYTFRYACELAGLLRRMVQLIDTERPRRIRYHSFGSAPWRPGSKTVVFYDHHDPDRF